MAAAKHSNGDKPQFQNNFTALARNAQKRDAIPAHASKPKDALKPNFGKLFLVDCAGLQTTLAPALLCLHAGPDSGNQDDPFQPGNSLTTISNGSVSGKSSDLEH